MLKNQASYVYQLYLNGMEALNDPQVQMNGIFLYDANGEAALQYECTYWSSCDDDANLDVFQGRICTNEIAIDVKQDLNGIQISDKNGIWELFHDGSNFRCNNETWGWEVLNALMHVNLFAQELLSEEGWTAMGATKEELQD